MKRFLFHSGMITALFVVIATPVFALTPFPSLNATLEYYGSANGNAPSLVAVIIPQDLAGREIRGVEIPLGGRQNVPTPTGTALFVNDGEWGASDWTCTIGSQSVRCQGKTALAVGKKTCIALYLPKEITPPSGLSLGILDGAGEQLFSVGAMMATSAATSAPSPVSQLTSQSASLPSSSGVNSLLFVGLAIAAAGGGLIYASRSRRLAMSPVVGSAVMLVGGLLFVYSMIPQRNFYSWTWGCPQNCTAGEMRCRVTYAVSTSTDSVETEQKNELEAQKTIASMKLLELPFSTLDNIDVATADSLKGAYVEIATALLGIPDAPAEAYGSSVPFVGSVVDLDAIMKFAKAVHEMRVLADRAAQGMQLLAHYEVDTCELSSCWGFSSEQDWVNQGSWFVPLTPEGVAGNTYKHPLFDQQKSNGVYLWTPAVLSSVNEGKGNAVMKDIAKQAIAAMPSQCGAIVNAGKEDEFDFDLFDNPGKLRVK